MHPEMLRELLGGGRRGASVCRERRWKTTSKLIAPSAMASRAARATASPPWVLMAFSRSTNSRSPPGRSLRVLPMVWIGAGSSQSWKGAPLRKAPGWRFSTGR